MAKVLIGIVSYYPKDIDRRGYRVKEHQAQMKWIEENVPATDILIVSQGYSQEDFIYSDKHNVRYIDFPEPCGVAQARNILLKEFYASEYDYIALCDDDCTLYDRFSPKKFLEDIFGNPEKFFSYDAFCPLNPRFAPYKEQVACDNRNNTHYKFTRAGRNWLHWFFLKNLKKYHDKEIYIDDKIDPSRGEGYEDLIFCLDLIVAGMVYGELQTVLLDTKNIDAIKSTIFESNSKREEFHKKSMHAVNARFRQYGLKMTPAGRWDSSEFQKYNMTPKVGYIPRSQSIDIFETLGEEFAKLYKSNKRKLF